MRKKTKNILTLCIIAATFACSISMHTQTKAPVNIVMDYIYFYIYRIDITDDFDGKRSGTIDLYFSFKYERMFTTLGDRLYNDDNQYPDTSVDWQYSYSFDNDDTGIFTVSDTFPTSYAHRISYGGPEYYLGVRVKKGLSNEYEYINLGELTYYNNYYWTSTLPFYEKFDGAMKIYYKIVW